MSTLTVTELFSLQGQVALITGASGHLGLAMAHGLAEAGASVVVSSRSLQRAEEIAGQLPRAENVQHHGIQMDQMDEKSISSGFASAVECAGGVDILVNNGHEHLAADWKTVTAEQFQRQLDNLTGYFLLARHFRDHIVQRQAAGSLILIGSMYGVVGSYPEVYDGISSASPVAYHALKGGIVQMNRNLAVTWAPDGVRVNCLSPGPFPGEAAPSKLIDRITEKSPMRRMGRPDELKGALVFLASQASSYMTGQNLLIDGGWTAW